MINLSNMKTLMITVCGILMGTAADYYLQLPERLQRLLHPAEISCTPAALSKLPARVASNVTADGSAFLQAAYAAERGDTTAFNEQVYQLGEQINTSVISSLNLSPQAKTELDGQLAVSYPEIAKEIRTSYLQQIRTLKTPPAHQFTSTLHKTKAEILAGAINGTMCSFSNLVLIPMRINIGIAGNIAAGYAFNDPCQYLISGVTAKVGDQIYHTGIIKDLEQLQTRLTVEKRSAIAQLATSETQINVQSCQTINRSIGKLTHWEAARLTVDYTAFVQYGYDLSEGFTIRRNDAKRTITIELPDVKLLHVNMDPINTNAQDGGMIDLTNENFRAVYQKARADAITLAEKQGAKIAAVQQIRSLLSCIYQPFTSNGKYTYQLIIDDHLKIKSNVL